jgi:Uma2 family endonuclease
MMTSASPQGFREAEYLALEAASETKHEFVNGAIVAMAGARPPHNALVVNCGAALVALTRGRGRIVLSSDQRVHVATTGLYTYPDVTVARGERRYRDDSPPSLLNPMLLVEVTSESTEDYDRGSKFVHYQAIASLREYLIASHREKRIDHHRRLESGQWLATTYSTDDADVELPALSGSIRLADVYADVDLSEGRAT